MSVFGDGTPAEDLLEAIKRVRFEHSLSWRTMLGVIHKVLHWLTDVEYREGRGSYFLEEGNEEPW